MQNAVRQFTSFPASHKGMLVYSFVALCPDSRAPDTGAAKETLDVQAAKKRVSWTLTGGENCIRLV